MNPPFTLECLFFGSAPPSAALSLPLSPSFSLCILPVCARICVPSVYFGNPGGFGPTPRSLNALWHSEALRWGDTDAQPNPLLFLTPFPSLPSLIPFLSQHPSPRHARTHALTHIYICRKHTSPLSRFERSLPRVFSVSDIF